jgi:hypothetical protein
MRDFAPHQQALELKELGFDEECLAIHRFVDGELNFMYVNTFHSNDDVNEKSAAAPTFSQAFRWFREKHTLGAIVSQFGWSIENEFGQIIHNISDDENPLCYEEAELACLIRLIEITRTK